ncbi:nucleotidyltransferase family protein [Pseudochryseolinea flava]|uniref:Nucleotidyl transferase n=1 Tax=Pseudochryseolinea flava TaxID=2059302 RepID=A0A364Y3L1_9BACT|nr:nucleotidyltransferase family protein [Pseudochryseolinea flava]RAW01302.1 nucleotidyl transferase [Pseudochryseolinea flava]
MFTTKLVLDESTTVNSAIELLDKSGIGILPVVDKENNLIGIITDGDVRRALLANKLDLQSIINRNPKKVTTGISKAETLELLKQKHLRHMPVVDGSGKLIDIICLENLVSAPKSNVVIIMAGGLGSRLGNLTQETPKPMLLVSGKPILERIVENLKAQGFSKFIFCLNYKSEVIQEYFKDGARLGVNIHYTIEEKRMGTAGALSLIDRHLLTEPFLVLNADVITNIDLDEVLKFHQTSSSIATMCVKQQSYEIPFACVEFGEQMDLLSLVEKPNVNNYINAGIYVLDPEAIDFVPSNEFYDMPSLFLEILKRRRTTKVFKFDDYWIDIGRPVDYNKANTEVS